MTSQNTTQASLLEPSVEQHPSELVTNQAVYVMQSMRAEAEFIAIEYGLGDLESWLPRHLAAKRYIQVNRLSYERTYESVRGARRHQWRTGPPPRLVAPQVPRANSLRRVGRRSRS